ncbi:cold-shock protein [Parapedobacter defluvii]|uniref:Cold-shock protein n=1 Tax=Parapedobacter defluvii TaxID=2045106 RepID=A0ABQ1LB20_9SPHI|nr:cold shock domain-containing protein [Parapedobacter defluvii]RQP08417.1 MAG: cold shock domain-containing protein [Parapedobacter sp.]GGC19712.1 cold-shock protein [Parapedobacter defluvii]
MGRSQETFNKKENVKKKLQKQKEKEQRREERRQAASSNKGKSLDDMMAYVDENGNITTTPPDPKKLKPISPDEIIISTPKLEDSEEDNGVRTGRVAYFNDSKGYGFISDAQSGERIFVHINDLAGPIAEEDRVEFTLSKGPKGLQATSVKKLS